MQLPISLKDFKKFKKLQKLLKKIERLESLPASHPSFDFSKKIALKAKTKIFNN